MSEKKVDWGQAAVDALNRAVLKEEEEMRSDGEALSAGTYKIHNKHDLTFAIPRVGYAPDRTRAKIFVEARAKDLGLWDERMDGWRDSEKD